MRTPPRQRTRNRCHRPRRGFHSQHRLTRPPIHRKIPPQRPPHRTPTPRRISTPNRPQQQRRLAGDHPRPTRVHQPTRNRSIMPESSRNRPIASQPRRNGPVMQPPKHSPAPADAPLPAPAPAVSAGDTPRRPLHNIDQVPPTPESPATPEPPSVKPSPNPARTSRRPSPTERVEVVPAPAPVRRPPPAIP